MTATDRKGCEACALVYLVEMDDHPEMGVPKEHPTTPYLKTYHERFATLLRERDEARAALRNLLHAHDLNCAHHDDPTVPCVSPAAAEARRALGEVPK